MQFEKLENSFKNSHDVFREQLLIRKIRVN